MGGFQAQSLGASPVWSGLPAEGACLEVCPFVGKQNSAPGRGRPAACLWVLVLPRAAFTGPCVPGLLPVLHEGAAGWEQGAACPALLSVNPRSSSESGSGRPTPAGAPPLVLLLGLWLAVPGPRTRVGKRLGSVCNAEHHTRDSLPPSYP